MTENTMGFVGAIVLIGAAWLLIYATVGTEEKAQQYLEMQHEYNYECEETKHRMDLYDACMDSRTCLPTIEEFEQNIEDFRTWNDHCLDDHLFGPEQ